MTDWRYVEQFGAVDIARPFRILPVGKFKRFGRKVEVTPEMVAEMASNFGRVPDTTLPVNTEHQAQHGKIGDIASVEARADGLYASLALMPDGETAVRGGKFQYFSPEIIWGPTDFDGAQYKNVLMGLAVTNSPYFGKETALYSVDDTDVRDIDPAKKEQQVMSIDELKAALESFGFKPAQPAPTPPAIPVTETEEYKALATQASEAQKKLEAAETAQRIAANVAKYMSAVEVDGYTVPDGLAEKFAQVAEIDAALADGLAQEYKALAEQAKTGKLFAEIGTTAPGGGGASDAEKYIARVEHVAKERGIEKAEAFKAVALEEPELYKAYVADSAKRSGKDN